MWVRERLGAERVSERRACQVLGQVRSTQRRERQIADDEARLVARMVELATQYGRYGPRVSWGRVEGESNVGPAKCWDRLDRPSEGTGIFPMMRPDWWLRW